MEIKNESSLNHNHMNKAPLKKELPAENPDLPEVVEKKEKAQLSPEQSQALQSLQSGGNVFITGGAGSGKSFLMRHFIESLDVTKYPVLASTGAAAVLVGGRTFHSFFGLGILEGGAAATIAKAQKNKRLMSRIRKIKGIVVDEISMISGEALGAAQAIAQLAKGNELSWGGLRIIVVGDFCQLPPVSFGNTRDWCFLSPSWMDADFKVHYLKGSLRTSDADFIQVLGDIRQGVVSSKVKAFLDSKIRAHDTSETSVRLYPRRKTAEDFNAMRLEQLSSPSRVFKAELFGEERALLALLKNAPVQRELTLKVGARVMFVQNDPDWRWVNGSVGVVKGFKEDQSIIVQLGKKYLEVEPVVFSIKDADDEVLASITAIPLVLAWATTIHKSQGATLESIWTDLGSLWEPGQAYVALSRLVSSDGLSLLSWHPRSILVDDKVIDFYSSL